MVLGPAACKGYRATNHSFQAGAEACLSQEHRPHDLQKARTEAGQARSVVA